MNMDRRDSEAGMRSASGMSKVIAKLCKSNHAGRVTTKGRWEDGVGDKAVPDNGIGRKV